jgi:uncharacterized phiE125 gp8 family phage protein
MTIERTTNAATEPVTNTEVTDALVQSVGWDNARVTLLISAAREAMENITDRSFVTQTWTMHLDAFPEVIYVPKGKLIAISSLKYDDISGTEQTLNVTTDYTLDNNSKIARISPVTSWPSTLTTQKGVVRLVYTAGYGSASDVPSAIKEAVISKVEQLYSKDDRGNSMIDSLISPYKIFFNYSING